MIKKFKRIDWPSGQTQPLFRAVRIPGYEIGTLVRLEETVKYQFMAFDTENKVAGYSIKIPMGFFADGNSSPQIFWGIFPNRGLHDIPWCLHDGLFRSNGGEQYPIKDGLNKGIKIDVMVYEDQTWKKTRFGIRACNQLYKAAYISEVPEKRRVANISYVMLNLFGKRHFGKKIPGEDRLS